MQNKNELKYQKSIEAFCAYLQEIAPLPEGWSYNVHLWGAEDCGLRISEFGCSGPTAEGGLAGSAFMRSDPPAMGHILAAEEFLLMHACTWDERDEELERAKDRLRYLFRAAEPLAAFLAAEEQYLTATGWKKVAGVGRFNSWSHPDVMNGATHTQPAAVRRQQEHNGYLRSRPLLDGDKKSEGKAT